MRHSLVFELFAPPRTRYRVPDAAADVSVHAFGMTARRAGIFAGSEDTWTVAKKIPSLRTISKARTPAACVLRTQAGDAR